MDDGEPADDPAAEKKARRAANAATKEAGAAIARRAATEKLGSVAALDGSCITLDRRAFGALAKDSGVTAVTLDSPNANKPIKYKRARLSKIVDATKPFPEVSYAAFCDATDPKLRVRWSRGDGRKGGLDLRPDEKTYDDPRDVTVSLPARERLKPALVVAPRPAPPTFAELADRGELDRPNWTSPDPRQESLLGTTTPKEKAPPRAAKPAREPTPEPIAEKKDEIPMARKKMTDEEKAAAKAKRAASPKKPRKARSAKPKKPKGTSRRKGANESDAILLMVPPHKKGGKGAGKMIKGNAVLMEGGMVVAGYVTAAQLRKRAPKIFGMSSGAVALAATVVVVVATRKRYPKVARAGVHLAVGMATEMVGAALDAMPAASSTPAI